ncbi:S1C family serine protease [Microbacterium sp. ASV49]|uniref:Trypsin-like peptidase domain-containing protein n=1 Tax=Microbacterium candidum TaxID=3041922 RepID=A0ABT7N330_9MICO|nr:trypsin-like peptidase domain-containing protein [Microbacterium sp. ASV49]MDL9981076.1 trypsin-like peptidase domain-containing protein [Microbacterium sp. ASV49]
MKTSHRRLTGWIAGGVAAAALCTGGIAIGAGVSHAAADAAAKNSSIVESTWYGGASAFSNGYGYGSGNGYGGGYGSGNGYGYGSGGGYGGGAGSSGSPTGATTTATDAQQKGVVIIDTVLAYDQAQAAGTGIVLSSSGEILTNNHVVAGATSIEVTIPSTGATYTASVVGTDATDDVAVLKLQGASGLDTAKLDSGGGVSTGDAVTAVGNAGGTGTLVQASGTVTGTGASITTQAEGSAPSESLSGLIETNADIQPGDSGGPLYDSAGEIVGIDTAASTNSATPDGYAIPISTALSIAHQIENGQGGSNITIGARAFLGIGLAAQSSADGAEVAAVYDGTPAASAGLAQGDVITGVDGTAISSGDDLSAALAAHRPGDTVRITWTDTSGASHTADVTLTSGPAA